MSPSNRRSCRSDPEFLTPGQLKCMLGAKSQEEVLKCLAAAPQEPRRQGGLRGQRLRGHRPRRRLLAGDQRSVASPTSGWNVGGHVLDRHRERRVARHRLGGVAAVPRDPVRRLAHGRLQAGQVRRPGTVNVSDEPDYVSIGGGVAVTADLHDKLITPRVAYSYRHDNIGSPRHPSTSPRPRRERLRGGQHVHPVADARSSSRTCSSRPSAAISRSLTGTCRCSTRPSPRSCRVGASVDLVNSYRLPIRPRAAPARARPLRRRRALRQPPAVRRRSASRSASTTTPGSRTRPRRTCSTSWSSSAACAPGRTCASTRRAGANFYQPRLLRASCRTGRCIIPTYRTTSRELAPGVAGTIGGRRALRVSKPEARTQYSVYAQGDILLQRFLDSLYVTALRPSSALSASTRSSNETNGDCSRRVSPASFAGAGRRGTPGARATPCTTPRWRRSAPRYPASRRASTSTTAPASPASSATEARARRTRLLLRRDGLRRPLHVTSTNNTTA